MKRAGRMITAVLFAALTLLSMAGFMHVFAPKSHPPQEVPFEAYDRAPMNAALTPAALRAQVDTITGFGSRFLGQPGFTRMADYLQQQFEQAGLEVFTQELDTVAPWTRQREILAADGTPLSGVTIAPVFPNHFQPMVTPPTGLTGTLLLMTDEVLLQRPRFDDCIAVIDADKPPRTYGFAWERYAQLGLRAVIVASRQGLAGLAASRWLSINDGLVAHEPVNYVRLIANEKIFEHLDETIALNVHTAYRAVPNRTVVGVLRSGRAVHEALVITASYDAISLLPDEAPGVLQAYGPAQLLQLLAGLAPQRADLRRDVIFVATGTRMMGCEAESRLLAATGPRLDRAAVRPELENRRAANETQRQLIDAARQVAATPRFLEDLEVTRAALTPLAPAAVAALTEQFHYVLNTLVMDDAETMLQAKLRFEEDDPDNLESEAYRAFLATKRNYDNTFSAAGYQIERLAAMRPEIVTEKQLHRRLEERLDALAAFHAQRTRQLDQELALHDLFARYDTVLTMAPELVPSTKPGPAATESVTFFMGHGIDHRYEGPSFNNVLVSALQRSGQADAGLQFLSYTKNHASTVGATVGNVPLGVTYWNQFSYPAFALVSGDRKETYDAFALPLEQPFMRNTESLAASLRWLGETALSLAYGNGRVKDPLKVTVRSYFGTVYVAGVGESVVPNHPMPEALVGSKGPGFKYHGHFRHPLLQTDPYGRYALLGAPSTFDMYGAYSPNAAATGADGILHYASDEGAAQSIYSSINIPLYGGLQTPVHLVLFRGAPVTILDLVNPQTLKAYAGVELAQAKSLTAFPSFNTFKTGGPVTTFIPPDERFIVKLKAGSVENDLVQTTRAVMLNTTPTPKAARNLGEINAPGYLAAQQPFLLRVPHETARSMFDLNSQRLTALERNRMADQRTRAFHAKAGDLLRASDQPAQPEHESILKARDSATYSILNYPVIRNTIFDAVNGILWYLFLLVPFVFFFEKLVFGFTDIRQQLAANGVIFLVVFLMLKLLHPAFEMIRSSLMILLGFVIFLISMGVIGLLSGRFQENLEALKRKRAQVAAAEVNTLGVVGTAFALGLNNMHRRKVRTGLTCATLVLITFAMLCFSTLQSDVVDSATAVGKANYQGLLVKPEQYRPISAAEKFALDVKYGDRFEVASRAMFVGYQTWDRELVNPELAISHTTAAGETRKVDFDTVIQFTPQEPLAPQMPLVTTNGWFVTPPTGQRVTQPPVMIPDSMARQLGITTEQVHRDPPVVTINGKDFRVQGLFDAEAFANLQDVDGRNLLPFDVTAMTTVRNTGGGRFWEVIAEPTDPQMDPNRVILSGTTDLGITVPNGFPRLMSIVVAMPDLSYREAKAEIGQYLEQTGKPTYYGLDGIAYLGKRFRDTSFAGLLDLLIPLFIASITVLNTIRGSVYERRDEIFVYNAVGIAPRYVFFMFMAEALVYSVVGTVLGYLLAQGSGSLLTALGWTGGLELNFTSQITVYVSITIILATLVSTYFPARSALEIAAPAEESGWKLPEPEGDRLSFALPFTFNHHDRVAILAFFHRYFLDHGEGSAARFFAGRPQLGVSERPDPLQPASYIPEVRTTIWLKPYDLGVSQELVIDLQTDPETHEYIARITLARLSGTREAWLRLNHSFVSQVRRHFLHWRAVGKEDREELYTEARRLLETSLTPAHA